MTRPLYVRAMDRLYDLCFLVAIVSIVTITILIFTGVVMRYVFWMGARFAEPMSIFFIVQLTMYGAAACYRARIHLRLLFAIDRLPARARQAVEIGMNVLMGVVAVAMIFYVTLLFVIEALVFPNFMPVDHDTDPDLAEVESSAVDG